MHDLAVERNGIGKKRSSEESKFDLKQVSIAMIVFNFAWKNQLCTHSTKKNQVRFICYTTFESTRLISIWKGKKMVKLLVRWWASWPMNICYLYWTDIIYKLCIQLENSKKPIHISLNSVSNNKCIAFLSNRAEEKKIN